MANKVLDIIITHYDEPWKIGKPAFDMLQNQRCMNYDNVQITLVQDGEEGALSWEELLSEYRYDVNIITIPHGGTAAARNAGIKNTNADWIMFCDFDDMFSDTWALRMIMNQFPVSDYDMFWGRVINEYKWNGNTIFPNRVDISDFATTNCKFYRRSLLKEHDIWFNTSVPYHYEYMFNSLVIAEIPPFRIAALTTDFYVYTKSFREDSLRNTPENGAELMDARFKRGLAMASSFLKRGNEYLYKKTIANIICTEYYRIYIPDDQIRPSVEREEFVQFFIKNKHVLEELSPAELDVIRDDAESETMSLIQDYYNKHNIEYYFVNDELSFEDWLMNVERQAADIKVMTADNTLPEDREDTAPVVIGNNPIIIHSNQYDGVRQIAENHEQESVVHEHREPRVAVYCGTYNTYMSMATSAKSLLYHTRMDKIYFLIEDDVFPFDLPDNGIIECINVKNQTWFPKEGPNFNNDWSYMCMMRAVFSKLIPYKKILSFDIDIVVQEDIGCLFDDYDMTDYYIAGVAEPQRQKSSQDPLYINFGVVIMNLDKIRRDGIDDKVIQALNTQKFGCPEQDAFNKFCAWHILQLPNDYNATVSSHITGEAERERIIHYAGIRYWRHFGAVKEYNLKDWNFILERQAHLNA